MYRGLSPVALALSVVAVVVTGVLAIGQPALDDTVSQEIDRAAGDSARALDDLRALQSQFAELEESLEEREKADAALEAELSAIADKLRGRIAKALSAARADARAARSTASGADARADEALGRLSSLARDIALVTERLDYHLRHHEG